jgi:hypothetical protein
MTTKAKFVLVHRMDPNNVGDIAADPLQYFLDPEEYVAVDIDNLTNSEYPTDLPVIVGGGGLIGNEFFGHAMQSLTHHPDEAQLLEMWNKRWILRDNANTKAYERFIAKYESLIDTSIKSLKTGKNKRFVWGAGHNAKTNKFKENKQLLYPDFLREYDLVGIRDWGQGYNWVPCASCMHPAFDEEYEITNDVIWFEHKKQLIKDFGTDPIPRLVNSGNNIAQTIALLGSAKTIVTNSYHGAYWGTLLGRKVVLVEPWSTKFRYFKHMPRIVSEGEDWSEYNIPTYPNALEECRTATLEYWEAIQAEVAK